MDFPENPAVYSVAPTPTDFYSQKLWGSISQVQNLSLWGLAWGWDCSLPRYPPDFYTPHVNMGPSIPSPPLCATLCLLASSPYLHVSAPPILLEECSFFKSLVVRLPYSSIFWQFWVLFVWYVVVIPSCGLWGGKACLLMPPSWLEVNT